MKSSPLVAIVLFAVGLLTKTAAQTNAPSRTAPTDISKLKVEIVHEMKPGSRDYDVLSVFPLFQPNDGKGTGLSHSTYNPKEIYLSVDPKATTGGLIKATVGGPKGNFEGSLSETNPNSGIFTDSKHSLRLTLTGKTDLLAKNAGLFVARFDSASLGLSDAAFSFMESDANSRFFYIPIKTAEVTFDGSYDPSVINNAHVKVVWEELSGPNESSASVVENLVESAAGSKTFANPYYSGLTMTLSKFGDFASTGRMTATFSGEPLSYVSFVTTITRSSLSSMTFTQAATLGQPANYNEGTDEAPDDPDVTGDGVIQLRIKGAPGPLTLIIQTDLSRLQVKALPVPGDPSTLLTGKLLLVPKDYRATGTPRPSPLDLPTICPLLTPSTLDGRVEGPVDCTTDWPSPL